MNFQVTIPVFNVEVNVWLSVKPPKSVPQFKPEWQGGCVSADQEVYLWCKTKKNTDVLYHELYHATQAIMKIVHINNEETAAHIMGWLSVEVGEKIRGGKA